MSHRPHGEPSGHRPASGKMEEYELVYPADADVSLNRISVLAPTGAAILGCRLGDDRVASAG